MGISPLVRMIERQRRDSDRHAAAALARDSDHLRRRHRRRSSLIGDGRHSAARRTGRGAVAHRCRKIEQVQQALVRHRHPAPADHARRSRAAGAAPGGGATRAVGTIFGAVRNVVGGVFGIVTLLLLTFYMLVESREISVVLRPAVSARAARARRGRSAPPSPAKVSAWLGGQLLLALHHRPRPPRSASG